MQMEKIHGYYLKKQNKGHWEMASSLYYSDRSDLCDLLFFTGILVDSTKQYAYVFFACSITGSTAGLFIMLSFYWLDRQKDREVKISSIYKGTNLLKPSIKMTMDCDYSPVPLNSKNHRDIETDVWLGCQDTTSSTFLHRLLILSTKFLTLLVFSHPPLIGGQSAIFAIDYTDIKHNVSWTAIVNGLDQNCRSNFS